MSRWDATVHTALEQLVKQGDACTLSFVLRRQPYNRRVFAIRNEAGLTLLHEACLLGELDVVSALVEQGADVGVRSSVGWTSLHAATLSGSLHLVHHLVLSCCADVMAVDDMGCCAVDLTRDECLTRFLTEQMKLACRRKRSENEDSYGFTVAIAMKPDGGSMGSHVTDDHGAKRDSGVYLMNDDVTDDGVAAASTADSLPSERGGQLPRLLTRRAMDSGALVVAQRWHL